MKKLALLAAFALTGTMAFGQGSVQFANTTTTRVTTNQNLTVPLATGNARGGGAYTFGLFVGPDGGNYASMQPVGAYAVNSPTVAGVFGAASPASFPYGGSGAVGIQVRGWSTGLGATWAEVAGKLTSYDGTGNAVANFQFAPGTYFLGSSAIGSVVPATGIGVPPAIFPPLGAFSLNEVIPVPEPTTIALLGLGLAGLLFIRRRK